MPTYQYRCKECSSDLEVVQKFTDASLTECPRCRGELRKVFNAVGVVFKGSGFYATDSRGKDTASAAPATSSESTSSANQSTPSESKPSESKPSGDSSSSTSTSSTSTSSAPAAPASA